LTPKPLALTRHENPLPGFDFEKRGNLHVGDIIYSYSTLYVQAGYFDHIMLVASIDENGARRTVSNMVRNHPYNDCSIEEVTLYTPGDRENGVFNKEWNGFGYGKTGNGGFDVFRWNWITHHISGTSQAYSVRWGDTLETIAFDWKLSPEQIAASNGLTLNAQLNPGQIISLPAASGN
jgi:hypothetical protein